MKLPPPDAHVVCIFNNKWSYAHSFRRSTFVFSFFTWCLCCLDLVGSFCFIRIWMDNASVWMNIASVTSCMIVFGLFCFVCSVVWNFHFRINSKIMLTFILFSQHHLFMIYRLLFYVWHSLTVHYWVFFVVIFSASTSNLWSYFTCFHCFRIVFVPCYNARLFILFPLRCSSNVKRKQRVLRSRWTHTECRFRLR